MRPKELTEPRVFESPVNRLRITMGKIGLHMKSKQNWPKLAMHEMRFLHAGAYRCARGLIFSAFDRNWNLMGVCR